MLKKCLVVKVEGCERKEVRNERLPIVVSNSDDRVCNEADDHGLDRFDVVPIGLDRSECVHEGGMDTSELLGEKPSIQTEDF